MCENKKYPRVLVLGHSFNNYNGMGITLTNLFAEWPKSNIAILANSINSKLCDEIRPCAKYIGTIVDFKTSVHTKVGFSTFANVKNVIKKLYYKFGLHEIRASKKYPDTWVKEAKDFNPEIVFCALGSYIAMKRCENFMAQVPNAKLVLYIVDDWVNTKVNTRYFSTIWKNMYDKKFKQLIESASGLLSICQYMSDEYMKQYQKKFYPFHNPVNLNEWNQLIVSPKYEDNITSLVYMGKINDDTYSCLKTLSEAIALLNADGYNYVLDIYSPDYSSKAIFFSKYSATNVLPQIPHNEVSSVLKSYTSLFLPLGFSQQSRSYVRLSMPTKLSEYLASERPILLYCPGEIALAKYLEDKECAILCTSENINSLKSALLKFQDVDNYNRLLRNSSKLAENHDVTIVREQFRKVLNYF